MRIFVTISCLIIFFSNYGQNLVPNPSFEVNDSCPNLHAEFSKVSNWISPKNHLGTPDYFHSCCPTNWVAVPGNYAGYEFAASGNAYAGLSLIYQIPEFREYIEVKLDTELVKDVRYRVTYSYSLADSSRYATGDFGIRFSNQATNGLGNWNHLEIEPQLIFPGLTNNKNGWLTITSNYIADGGERFIMFGNFKNDSLTSKVYLGPYSFNGAYIYIDDVSVFPCEYPLDFRIDTTMCKGETLVVDLNIPYATFTWQDSSHTQYREITKSGIYWVEINLNDCITRDSILVNFVEDLELGNDTTLCFGEGFRLNPGVSNAIYTWQDGSQENYFFVDEPGTYWVEVTLNSCSFSDSIHVSFRQNTEGLLGQDTILCVGQSVLLDAQIPDAKYLWQNGDKYSKFKVDSEGIYWVQLVFDNCIRTDTIFVEFHSLSIDIFLNDTMPCMDRPFVLDATFPNVKYNWSDNSNYPILELFESGRYWLELSNICGYVADTIEVTFQDCDCKFYIPNTFSPNNDGINDVFQPVNNCHLESYKCEIYNRWGELIFRSINLEQGWDGSVFGVKIPSGIYSYRLEYAVGMRVEILTGILFVSK